MADTPFDKSSGYEEIAEHFIAARNFRIGPSIVREWGRLLPPGSAVLDVGCGYGLPISMTLVEEGFAVYGVDASPRLVEAFRARLPGVCVECAPVEESEFHNRTFDGVVAWGLMFLLAPSAQKALIRKVAGALNPGGRFLFTAPQEAVTWNDSLTGRASVSLGEPAYLRAMEETGLAYVGSYRDEGDNYYYSTTKPAEGLL